MVTKLNVLGKQIIPIRLDRHPYLNYNIVEYMLHNVCNYDCSFCSSHIKDGSNRWKTLEEYKAICVAIIEQSSKPVWFRFTGGEPTLFPEFQELLEFVKSMGSIVTVISNGSRTLRYWKELKEKNVIDYLVITYHPEQTSNISHYIELINMFGMHGTPVQVIITSLVDYFDDALDAHNTFLSKCSVTSLMQQINDVQNMKKYTDEQIDILKKNTQVSSPLMRMMAKIKPYNELHPPITLKVLYSNGETKIESPSSLIKNSITDFRNWECDIGMESIRIENDFVYRGVCRQGGATHISEGKFFSRTPIICESKFPCICYTDVQEPKRKLDK